MAGTVGKTEAELQASGRLPASAFAPSALLTRSCLSIRYAVLCKRRTWRLARIFRALISARCCWCRKSIRPFERTI